MREADLTLEKALDICRANEATEAQLKTLTSNSGASPTMDEADVNTVERERQRTPTDKRRYQCGKCGSWHTRQQTCPALGAECHKCGRKNHFARACRSKPRRGGKPKIHSIEQESSDEDGDMYIATIDDESDSKDWKVIFSLNKHHMTFKLDTGAHCNVISKKTYNQVSKRPLKRSRANLITFGGHRMKTCVKTVISLASQATPSFFNVAR